MKKYEYGNLNIKRLMELGDLDIRGKAEKNENLIADDYFSSVERFIENAPEYGNAFARIPEFKNNPAGTEEKISVFEETAQKLEELRDTLEIIGYENLNADLENICECLKNGSLSAAEKLCEEVFAGYKTLLERTKIAYKVKRFAPKSMNNTEKASEKPILLKEALEYLDYEEENRKLRILAVDDVSVVLNTVMSILNPYYEVFALKDCTQIEKFLVHTTPELFLLDIEMNEMSGFDLVPVIRRFKEHKDTPIIFLTGNASLNNLKDAIALGVCDFIIKPVNKDVLLEKIQKNIYRKKAY